MQDLLRIFNERVSLMSFSPLTGKSVMQANEENKNAQFFVSFQSPNGEIGNAGVYSDDDS